MWGLLPQVTQPWSHLWVLTVAGPVTGKQVADTTNHTTGAKGGSVGALNISQENSVILVVDRLL